jgi:hypothetical protein
MANSLFGGASPEGVKDPHHVRSGEGRQWPRTFTPELKAEFKRIHPEALQRLGYETNSNW